MNKFVDKKRDETTTEAGVDKLGSWAKSGQLLSLFLLLFLFVIEI